MANAVKVFVWEQKEPTTYGDWFETIDVVYSIIGATRTLVGARIDAIVRPREGSDITTETLSTEGANPKISIPNTSNLHFQILGRAMTSGYENTTHNYIMKVTITYADGNVKTSFKFTIKVERK